MGVFEHFPYVNFHELNLDWIVRRLKEVEQNTTVDAVARAGVAQNAQDISDLTTTVTNNATTAHNEALAAQNTATNAYNTANSASNTATTANNTANAAQTAINTLSGYFKRFQITIAAGGSYSMANDIGYPQAGVLFAIPRGYSLNNCATMMFIYRPNATTYYHTDMDYGAASQLRMSLDATGDMTNSYSSDVTYDCMLYLIRT